MKFVYGDHLRGEREAAAAAGHYVAWIEYWLFFDHFSDQN